MTRCTGHCCQAFPLPVGPERYLEDPPTMEEAEYVGAMLIHLGVFTECPHTGETHEPLNYYACRHFDEVAGNCRAYETRPRMCREYPYGNACEHGDRCEWKEAAEVSAGLVSMRKVQEAAARASEAA